MIRALCALLVLTALAGQPVAAQAVDGTAGDRATTGGAQTLEDILARQRGEDVPSRQTVDTGSAGDAARGISAQLGLQAGPSDSDVWEDIRFNAADNISVSAGGDVAKVLVQDGGMWWHEVRSGPLKVFGGALLLGMLGLLALFYLVKGRIRVESGLSGVTIQRFKAVERFGHWLLAGSFMVLALTGLITLFGRILIIPIFGHEAFSVVAIASKWVHNNISWAFMIALVMVFFFWVVHNIPNRTDLQWLAKGGGFVGRGHPHARKFNAGQKIVFWSVILLGGSISLSGLSLLFPFELPMFAKTFGIMNATGIPGLFGAGFPTDLAPHEEMQYAALWHAIVSFVLIAIIFGHIYIGTVGMEGAYDAMGSGEVDVNWAREHHDLWVEEVAAKGGLPKGAQSPTLTRKAQKGQGPTATPAE